MTRAVEGRQGRWSRRARWLTTTLGLLALPACLSERPLSSRLGFGEDRADDAVGFVTISAPLFTPMDERVGGDKRLQFGDLRKESSINESIQATSFRSDTLQYDMLRLRLAAKIAGAVISTEETVDPTSDSGDSPVRKTSRKFDSPGEVSPPNAEPLRAEVLEKLVALLAREPQAALKLPMDERATLIAAMKTYMVNLEEYYNAEGFDFDTGLQGRYVPYKMHFTVTAEPGWFSRFNKYDAVLQVSLYASPPGTAPSIELDAECACCAPPPKPPGKSGDEIHILHVSPIESAQAVDEFSAALLERALALSVSAPLGDSASAAGALDRLQATARRLQGLRAHKTLAVGFPADNAMRIRFLAQRAGTEEGRDLQVVSRVLTATVLVPTRLAGYLDEQLLLDTAGASFADYRKLIAGERVRGSAAARVTRSLAEPLRRLAKEAGEEAGAGLGDYGASVLDELASAIEGGFDPAFLAPTAFNMLRAEVTDAELKAAFSALPPGEDSGSSQTTGFADAVTEFKRVLTSPESLTNFLRDAVGETASSSGRPADSEKAAVLSLLARGVEDYPQLLEEEVPSSRASRWRGYAAMTLIATIYRAMLFDRGIEDVEDAIDKQSRDVRGLLACQRCAVRRMLAGCECQLDVQAWFAPSVFGSSGLVSPPRDYLFAIDPSDRRVRAVDVGGVRTAPIPPWLGPLDDPARILRTQGTYNAPFAREAATQVAVAAAAQAKDRADKALTDAKSAPGVAVLLEALTTCKKRLSEHRETLQQAEAALDSDLLQRFRALDAAAEQADSKSIVLQREAAREWYGARFELARLQANGDANGSAVESALATYRDKRSAFVKAVGAEAELLQKALRQAYVAVQAITVECESLSREPAVVRVAAADASAKAASQQLAKATKEAELAEGAVLGRGHASVLVEYESPSVLLDAEECLVHRADTWLRLRYADTSDGDGAAGAGSTSSGGTVWFPMPSGHHTRVLEAKDFDLSLAVRTQSNGLAQADSINILVELLVLPKGQRPEDAWMGGAARSAVSTVVVTPATKDMIVTSNGEPSRSVQAPAPAAKSDSPTTPKSAGAVQLELKGIEVDLVPPALQK
ncbi:MAG: hypothetical protein KDB73_01345 [Planctomycetes bacterium]|nr:hypothetical protein [Planctomycetota bacterium]